MPFIRKDFISIKDLAADDLLFVLSTADAMKIVLTQKNKKAPHLQGKSVIMVFYEKSTRTRLSYQLAAQYLSAGVVDMSVNDDFCESGNLIDMGNIIDQMGGDFIIIRHPMSGSARLLAQNVNAGVINAGDGLNENPSQALLDLMTIKYWKGGFDGLKVAIIGDIMHSRVTHSNIWALLKLGTQVTLAGPPTLVQPEWSNFGVEIRGSAADAVKGADVVMAVRMPTERKYGSLLPSLNEYRDFFRIDDKILKYAKSDVIVMHPGPINRGIELSSQIIDSKRCLVDDQIANGVAVRMALLYLLSLSRGEGII